MKPGQSCTCGICQSPLAHLGTPGPRTTPHEGPLLSWHLICPSRGCLCTGPSSHTSVGQGHPCKCPRQETPQLLLRPRGHLFLMLSTGFLSSPPPSIPSSGVCRQPPPLTRQQNPANCGTHSGGAGSRGYSVRAWVAALPDPLERRQARAPDPSTLPPSGSSP